jgi:hypothetical protein
MEIRKANWIGHILRRNCLLKYIIGVNTEGRIEVTENEEEDLSCYQMTSSKREGSVN